MATKKKKVKRAVYKKNARGKTRKVARIKGALYRNSKRGTKIKVKRINPGLPAFVQLGVAVALGLAAGVATRVIAHKAAPGSVTAARVGGGLGLAAGIGLACFGHPLPGLAIAMSSADGLFQNDAVFKVESALSGMGAFRPAALGQIYSDNMAAMLPQFADGGMGQIFNDDMTGFETNPFD